MKMEIIAVDLGITAESIISDDIEKLTGKNEADIQQMVDATRQKIDESYIKQEQEKQKQEQITMSKHDALERSFQFLKSVNGAMLPLSEVAKPAEPIFAPNATFISQFNKFLREAHCGEYVLSKHTKGGKTVYKLRLFNMN